MAFLASSHSGVDVSPSCIVYRSPQHLVKWPREHPHRERKVTEETGPRGKAWVDHIDNCILCLYHTAQLKQNSAIRAAPEAARARAKDLQQLTAQELDSNSQSLAKYGQEAQRLGSCPPSDWALFHFPEHLDASSQRMMHQYFVKNPIRDTLYPFTYFGIQIDFEEDSSSCFRMLCSERLCFRAMLLLVSASEDLVLRQPLSNTTFQHLRHIFPVLNSRLSGADAYKDDTIVYVISIIASITILFGDYTAAKTHATGLSEVLRLRGGLGAVNQSPAIQFSLDRLNFSSSLVTTLWKPIYAESAWEPPVSPPEVIRLHHSQYMLCVDEIVSPNLATVFRHLQYTTILLNTHYYHRTPVDGMLIRQCLGFVHSSLIELEGCLSEKLSECLRLAMMAFLATTFRLPDIYEQHYCKTLANRFQTTYSAAKPSIPDLPECMRTWLTMMLLISVPDLHAPPIWASWDETTLRLSWDEARRHLKKVMWIDTFHDDLGIRASRNSTAHS
ncbi:hypothetical protein FZEAL_6634 [Fusarium zealandicum]|uniref:Uncharacterized protein n=1 Tax=Fusarium zealandicum TaxID=1053134 RepID=A0A8H4UI60_9HYPO|nr:hypothetical protein FZEAL_6634 [Fusarium zealandicum]